MTEWEQTAIMGENETHFMWRRGESNIMIRLHNDYNRGACAKILEKLAETNAESYDGYGEDTWCEKAADLIRKKCKAPEAAVHFFPGATQANFIVHAAALSPIQSVICPDSGHVYAHEAVRSRTPDTSWFRFHLQTEPLRQSRFARQSKLIMRQENRTISVSRRWFTFPSRPSGERCIPSRI